MRFMGAFLSVRPEAHVCLCGGSTVRALTGAVRCGRESLRGLSLPDPEYHMIKKSFFLTERLC